MDKSARIRLLVAEARLARLETAVNALANGGLDANYTLNQNLFADVQCNHCSQFINPEFACADPECPHGLGETND